MVWVDNEGIVVSTETLAGLETGPTIAPKTMSRAAESSTETSNSPVFTAPPPTPAALPSLSSSSIALLPVSKVAATSTTFPVLATSEVPPAPQAASVATDRGAKIIPSSGVAPSSGTNRQGTNTGNYQMSGLGIGYDILDDRGQCKSASSVANDFDTMVGYNIVRIYGTTCNQVQLVVTEAAQRGMKVFAGINDPTGDVASAIQEIISQAGSNLDVIDTINIGNEYVNNNGAGGVPLVTAAVAAARTALAGMFSGSIVTVDTFDALIANPALCAASDYCAANCHAFFDAGTQASGAGVYVQGQAAAVAAANPGKAVVITESGWAWADHGSNPNARATEAQQQAAIASLRSTFSNNLYLFQAFDTLYKGNNFEGYFGIYDHND